ncbi:hypothetical protein KEM52_006448 [Ascosphaera acerosa]|nr:hypothetical protein KEM52_006448 [Ascosphaera acerosa]
MKLSAAILTGLVAAASAAPLSSRAANGTDFSFVLNGLDSGDIRAENPLVLGDNDIVAFPAPHTKPGDLLIATVQPWQGGKLVGAEDTPLKGKLGYFVASDDHAKLFSFKFGDPPAKGDDVLTDGWFPAEGHPDDGPVGTLQVFFRTKEVNLGAFVTKDDDSYPRPISWYASDDGIPDGYSEIWISRPQRPKPASS